MPFFIGRPSVSLAIADDTTAGVGRQIAGFYSRVPGRRADLRYSKWRSGS